MSDRLPPLDTDRLLLRPLREDDLLDLHACMSDPEVTRYLSWEAHRTVEASRSFLRDIIDRYSRGELAPWGLEHRADGRLIGTCGFVTWFRHDARAEIAYALARRYWGQGLGTEAVRAVTAHGFAAMGLNRIEARCMVENQASVRVLEKAGMRQEGVLRQHVFVKGEYRDLRLYAMLRGEHRAASDAPGVPA